ncbi:MAG: DUF805 domain-containing protein [Sphingomonadales bacterium]|nr:DUF805 domain-containing protein [Sphingomonadales bacterium]
MEWMFLPFKRYAEFHGRSCRREYWMFTLLQFCVLMVAILIPGVLTGFEFLEQESARFDFGGMLFFILLGILFFIFLIPSIAVNIRRWHDLGYSGWMFVIFAVVGAIPYIGGIASIVNIIWFTQRGTIGANQYGEDPLGEEYVAPIV